MKLKDMKRIASARTKGEWRLERDGKLICSKLLNEDGIPTCLEFRTGSARDAQFICMAVNNWDKLMAVVEAAKAVIGYDDYIESFDFSDMESALKALESE